MMYADVSKDRIKSLIKLPVIFPIASIEQHSSHLPLGTDAFILNSLIEKLEDTASEKVIILPTEWIGFAEEHHGFPGTLSLSRVTLSSLLSDLTKWLEMSGFEKLVIVNSHGGNLDPLNEFEKHYRGAMKLKNYDVWGTSDELTIKLFGGIDEHAGDSESSVLRAVRPDLAVEGTIKKGYVARKPHVHEYPGFVLSDNGVLNFKPDIAVSQKKGRELLEHMSRSLNAFVLS